MECLHLIPHWFIGINVMFEVIFGIITGIVAIYSYKIYTVSCQREPRVFGIAFGSLSLSYFILALTNALFVASAGNASCLTFDGHFGIKDLLILAYILLFLLGFASLFYATLKVRSFRVFLLSYLFAILIIAFSINESLSVYLVTSIFLLFTGYHYIREYIRSGKGKTLLVFLGIVFLLFGNIDLIFVADYSLPILHVASHLLEFLGYLFILISLVSVLNNGKKKKQT